MLTSNVVSDNRLKPFDDNSNGYKCPSKKEKKNTIPPFIPTTETMSKRDKIAPAVAVAEKTIPRQRMYVFVLGQLSPLDKGIQAAHAIASLSLRNSDEYERWAAKDKTIILLHGGDYHAMNMHLATLMSLLDDNRHQPDTIAVFREESLNNLMTAIAILVDETVFDREKYQLEDKYEDGPYTQDLGLTESQIIDHFGSLKKYELARYISSQKLAR